MKIYLVLAVLMLIYQAYCSPIEGVLDAVKDTSSAIKKDIRGLFSYGRSLVFGDNHEEESLHQGRPATPSHGIVDEVSLKIHDVSQGVRETVQGVLGITDGDNKGHKNGLIKNVYDGVKYKVDKVKELLLGDKTDKINDKNYLDEQNNIQEAEDQILLNNKTSLYGSHVKDGENNNLDNAHNDLTKGKSSEEFNGSDLIDIRLASEDLAGNTKVYSKSVINGIGTAYDNVDDQVRRSYDNFKQSATENAENSKKNIDENLDKLSGYTTKLKDNVINNYNNNKLRN